MLLSLTACLVLLGHHASEDRAGLELVGPYFSVEAQINGKPARLLVDTGAGMNVLTPEAADRLGLQGGTPVTARGVGSEGVPARIVKLDAFIANGASLEKPQAVVIPLPPLLECDGLVGHGLLSAYVSRFDYAAKRLDFISPSEFVPPKGAVSVPLRVRNNIPEIRMEVAGIEGWVKVDSGASDSLTLFKAFIDAQGLRDKLSGIRPSFGGRGVGGTAAMDVAPMKGLRIAGFELPETIVGLSKQTAGAFSDDIAIGNLGAGTLRRFVFALDYSNGKAYFQKGPLFDSPERKDRLGVFLDFDKEGHRVLAVRPESPAAKAGIKAGERLLAIDGKPVHTMRALAVWELLRRPAGTRVVLGIRSSSGEERTVDLVLADF